jgi:N-acetylglutamate synthase-like GNAT family acetyltransferase
MSIQLEAIPPDLPDFVAALEAEDLPTDDLADSGRAFFRFIREGNTVGFGGFELNGEHALLRSIVVLPQARGRGMGRLATEILLRRAAELGVTNAYLLTTSSAAFFETSGFLRIPREEAPAEILATRQASSLCPSTAVLMMRRIDGMGKDLQQPHTTETAP